MWRIGAALAVAYLALRRQSKWTKPVDVGGATVTQNTQTGASIVEASYMAMDRDGDGHDDEFYIGNRQVSEAEYRAYVIAQPI